MGLKRRANRAARAAATQTKAAKFSLVVWAEQHALSVAIALVALASVRIGLTYTVFNHTSDEPNHIACGMEWIQRGTYTFETQHPPLARVAAALGPYLLGARVQGQVKPDSLEVPIEGARLLYRNHQYDLTLAMARLGILPFFWIACFVVYWWARRYYGPLTGLIALFLFSFVPPVLAHAGLATTDMALTAFVGAAFVAAVLWAEQPTIRHGLLFGVCSGLAIISKFSSLPFIPACLGCTSILYVLFERPEWRPIVEKVRRGMPSIAAAVLSCFMVIWAGFRFSIGKVSFAHFPLPFPELFSGIQAAELHNKFGHHTYLLGKYSVGGFWYYYPVVLGVKTPIALLLLFGVGVWLASRKSSRPPSAWQLLGFVAGILAVGFYSRINIGVRHILPIYMGMCILAAIAASRLPQMLQARWGIVILPALLLWFAGSSLLAHPDYLPYFNEFGGREPERIVVDSDLDWGQDIKRLSHRLQVLGADHVAFHSTLIFVPESFGMPRITPQDPFVPSPGWNAVSLTYWKLMRLGQTYVVPPGKLIHLNPDRKLWPDQVPRGELVGKSILLWNIAESEQPGSIVLH